MFDYLQKFNDLPKDLRDKISSPAVMAEISSLESKYGVDLAMSVMRVMIKTLEIKDLPLHFSSESGLSQSQSENLTTDLKDRVFVVVATYLGLKQDLQALDLNQNLEKIVKESGVNFTSQDLLIRFKQILNTYLRGIRTRIDTRNSFAKSVVSGGLNLDAFAIDKIFKVCDQLVKNLPAPIIVKPPISSALDKLIVADSNKARTVITHESEYNLKSLAASGQLKPLDTSHEIISSKPVLDLTAPTDIGKNLPAVIKKEEKAEVAKINIVNPLGASAIVPAVSQITAAAVATTIPTPPGVLINQKIETVPAKENTPTATIKPITTVAPKTPNLAAKIPLSSAAGLRPAVSQNRPRVDDIRPLPKIMGPIEELQFLDLINFRRLASNPVEITAKIYNKIRFLEKNGYEQMIAGVGAWRKGIINRLYLKMCQEAFTKGTNLKEIIIGRQKDNRECLTWEEISSIVALNKKLMF